MGWGEMLFPVIVGLFGMVFIYCLVLATLLAFFGLVPTLFVLYRQYKETGKIRFWNAVWKAIF